MHSSCNGDVKQLQIYNQFLIRYTHTQLYQCVHSICFNTGLWGLCRKQAQCKRLISMVFLIWTIYVSYLLSSLTVHIATHMRLLCNCKYVIKIVFPFTNIFGFPIKPRDMQRELIIMTGNLTRRRIWGTGFRVNTGVLSINRFSNSFMNLKACLGPPLLTWFNLNPSMDK